MVGINYELMPIDLTEMQLSINFGVYPYALMIKQLDYTLQ